MIKDTRNKPEKFPSPRQKISLLFIASIILLLSSQKLYMTFSSNASDVSPSGCSLSANSASFLRTLQINESTKGIFQISSHAKALPVVEFSGGDGLSHKFSEWVGRILLINLWAPWCAPCREEMSDLEKLEQALAHTGFKVIAIDLQNKPEIGQAFYNTVGLTTLSYYYDSNRQIPHNLTARGIPTTILVGKDGCEIARITGAAPWNTPDIRELLEQVIEQQNGKMEKTSPPVM